MFTIAELAWHYRVAPGTVGRWVCEDRIEGRKDPKDGRRKVYSLDQIQPSYNRRHGAATA